MIASVVIIVIFVFFALVGLMFLLGWRSFRDSNVFGGVILLFVTLVIFALVVFFLERSRRASQEQSSGLQSDTISLIK